MANELCGELKQGTEMRRALVRAGTAARNEFNAAKQLLKMAKQESFNEDFLMSTYELCPDALDAAMIDSMEGR